MLKNTPEGTDKGERQFPHKRSRRIIRRLFLVLLTAFLLFAGASWFFAYRLTGPRTRPVGLPPTDFPFAIQDAAWQTADGQAIRGWFVAADASRRAIVLLHGYGGDRRSMLPRAKFFRKHGYNVLLYDARACGESSGSFVTMGYYEANDLVAGLRWLRSKGMSDLACLGVSQGGATILMAAEKMQDVRCAICESVYDELAHAVDRRLRHYLGIPGWLGAWLLIPIAEHRTGVALDRVKPAEQIGKLRCPVFVISGAEDTKTWPEDTERLYEAARAPKELWMVPEKGHRDLYGPDYEEKVLGFLNRHMR